MRVLHQGGASTGRPILLKANAMTVWVLFGQLDPIQHDDRPVDEGAEDLVSIHATEAGALEAKQRAVANGVDFPIRGGMSVHVDYNSYEVREEEVCEQ